MAGAKRSWSDGVALVSGGGEGLGRAVALRLAAEGVRVVVTGPDERALGRVLGELTAGGGVGRHLAGDPGNRAVAEAAVGKALDHFGTLTFVILATPDPVGASLLASAGLPHLRRGGRILLAWTSLATPSTAVDATETTMRGLVERLGAELPFDGPTCNAMSWLAAAEADAERAAEVVLFLCSDVADGVNGQLLRVVG